MYNPVGGTIPPCIVNLVQLQTLYAARALRVTFAGFSHPPCV